MSDFQDLMAEVSQMIDDQGVDQDLVGDLDLQEVIEEMSGLVSTQLGNLSGLSEDGEGNEDILRSVMQQAALKAFFGGLAVGTSRNTAVSSNDLVIPLAAEEMEQLGIRILRDGVVTLHLLTPVEDDSP